MHLHYALQSIHSDVFRNDKCHLQGVHTKLITVYSKVDYICEFRDLLYILLRISVCVWINCINCLMYCVHWVAQLVEALRYKPEDRGFDSRWCHWNFSLT